MICRGIAGVAVEPTNGSPEGQYLKSYDPEAHLGKGWAIWTSDVEEAMTWPLQALAWECWRQVPKARRIRPDGRPNRPLTAFTVEICPKP